MIEYITGKIAALNPASVVVETASGIGFMLNISLQTYTALQGEKDVRLLVHEVIREDAVTLYGFLSGREREMFRALVGVSGVGATTAMVILSSLPVAELEAVIAGGDDSRLKKVKGIGQKTAQRIIVDLRDKIKLTGDVAVAAQGSAQTSETVEETRTALLVLGFQKQAVDKVLKKLFDSDPALSVEKAVKMALTML